MIKNFHLQNELDENSPIYSKLNSALKNVRDAGRVKTKDNQTKVNHLVDTLTAGMKEMDNLFAAMKPGCCFKISFSRYVIITSMDHKCKEKLKRYVHRYFTAFKRRVMCQMVWKRIRQIWRFFAQNFAN